MKETLVREQNEKMKLNTLEIAYIGMFIALIAVCSWITIPMAVPFTMQTFAIFATAAILGTKRGSIAVGLYILLGALGVPVFAGFSGGLGVLFGMTGGYIFGFLLSAIVVGMITKVWGKKPVILAVAMLLGLLICYAFGSVWFMYVYAHSVGTINVVKVLSWCVIPFILPDLAKIALAIVVSRRVAPYVNL